MSKYVYIMGRGHSGSTVLDCLLDNVEGVQGVGETVVGLKKGFCADGDEGRERKVAAFWNRVNEVCEDETDMEWAEVVEAYREQAHPAKFPKTLLADQETEFIARTVRSVRRVYESVLQVSGADIVVDSSKEVTRALLIAKHFEEGFIIHLVRDPIKVLASDLDRIVNKGKFRFLRKSYDTEGREYLFAFLTCVNWMVGNLLCEVVKLYCGDRCMTVRYEDLRRKPGRTLERIGDRLGIDVAGVVENTERRVPMSTGIGLNGNRMRRGSCEFVFDPGSSQREWPSGYEKMCRLVTYPLLKKYGYIGNS